MRYASKPRYPAPIIQPADRADIPQLVRVIIAAESPSLLTFLRYPSPESKTKAAREMIKALEKVFDMRDVFVMKAVDADTESITATAFWQLNGYTEKELGIMENESEYNPEQQATQEAMLTARFLPSRTSEINSHPGEALTEHIKARFLAFLDAWTNGTKHIYLALLMTDPRFQ